jgi:hypothetical protein
MRPISQRRSDASGSSRVSLVGDTALAIANYCGTRENLQQVDYTSKDCCGETQPARESRALPMKFFLNRLLLVGQLVVTLNVASTFAAKAAAPSFKFAGIPFPPGSTVQANVPLSAQEKSFAGQGGNPVPQSAVAVLATPANFDPRKSWPRSGSLFHARSQTSESR